MVSEYDFMKVKDVTPLKKSWPKVHKCPVCTLTPTEGVPKFFTWIGLINHQALSNKHLDNLANWETDKYGNPQEVMNATIDRAREYAGVKPRE